MADSIIDKDDIAPFTAQVGSYHVNNLQGRRSHFVEECKDWGFVCDNRDKRYGCIGFTGSGVFSHTVAVVEYSGKFNAYMQYLDEKIRDKSSRNLRKIAKYGIEAGSARKKGS